MSLLGRLRSWWRETFGAGAATDDSAAASAAYDYECVVCGTGVDGPEESCPLCHSSDVVRVGADSGGSAQATEPSFGRQQHVSQGDDESVARLRELREQDELLERHADRWRRADEGFVVETSDGERVVESREGVVEVLRNEGVE